ncbi:unnamed protein product, partial [Owenia fusiformis]
SYTGNILWPPGGSFESTCSLDVTYFPFDSQKCTLSFANAMYHGFHQNISSKAGVIMEKYTENGEWNVVKTDVRIFNDFFDMKPYPTIDFIIFLKRKSLYHIVNV